MVREVVKKSNGERAQAHLDVKAARAEVATATRKLDEAKASFDAVCAGAISTDDREKIREQVIAEDVERRLVKNAASQLDAAKAKFAALEVEADKADRRAAYDAAVSDLGKSEALFAEKFPEAALALLGLLSDARESERLALTANRALPEGEAALELPFLFAPGRPAILEVRLLDEKRNVLWAGDQFSGALSQARQ